MPIAVKFCMMLYRFWTGLCLLGVPWMAPEIPNFDRRYLEKVSFSVTCQMVRYIGSTGAL